MWGGKQLILPGMDINEMKKSVSSVMEVCRLATGRWEQKPTTGTPPLGKMGYAAAVIGNKIFYYGGYCDYDNCYHNSLHSFNVDTFHWEELSPTTPHHGPMMKRSCGMIAVQLDGEDYLVVIGGVGSSSNTSTQAGAQYNDRGGRKICNEIHYYKLSSGQYNNYNHKLNISPLSLTPFNHIHTLRHAHNCSAILGGKKAWWRKTRFLQLV